MRTRIPSSSRGPLLGGKYCLSELLGRGGMGAVYEGRHVRTGRPVAVKILHADYAGNAEVVRRFLREARVMAELDHPNVVDVLDMDEEADGTVFMVLERLDGKPLSELLKREGALPFARAAEVLLPVMRALAFAHGRGVVHRDLKPENIFLHRDAEGRAVPKVLDFGIAWALEDDARPRITLNGYVMGTPEYMSPEQAEGATDRIGAASDVWSMGVIWYEALTGRLPFAGSTPHEVMAAVTRAPFQLPSALAPGLAPDVAQALDRALARDAAKRYADMDAFLDALLAAMARPAPPPPEESAQGPDETTAPALVMLGEARHRGPSHLALASLVAAVAGVLTALGFANRPHEAARPAPHAAVAPAPRRVRPVFAPALLPTPVVAAPLAAAAAPPSPPEPPRRPLARPVALRVVRRAPEAPPAPRVPPDAAPAPRRARAELPRANAPLTDYDSLP